MHIFVLCLYLRLYNKNRPVGLDMFVWRCVVVIVHAVMLLWRFSKCLKMQLRDSADAVYSFFCCDDEGS